MSYENVSSVLISEYSYGQFIPSTDFGTSRPEPLLVFIQRAPLQHYFCKDLGRGKLGVSFKINENKSFASNYQEGYPQFKSKETIKGLQTKAIKIT